MVGKGHFFADLCEDFAFFAVTVPVSDELLSGRC